MARVLDPIERLTLVRVGTGSTEAVVGQVGVATLVVGHTGTDEQRVGMLVGIAEQGAHATTVDEVLLGLASTMPAAGDRIRDARVDVMGAHTESPFFTRDERLGGVRTVARNLCILTDYTDQVNTLVVHLCTDE